MEEHGNFLRPQKLWTFFGQNRRHLSLFLTPDSKVALGTPKPWNKNGEHFPLREAKNQDRKISLRNMDRSSRKHFWPNSEDSVGILSRKHFDPIWFRKLCGKSPKRAKNWPNSILKIILETFPGTFLTQFDSENSVGNLTRISREFFNPICFWKHCGNFFQRFSSREIVDPIRFRKSSGNFSRDDHFPISFWKLRPKCYK